MSVILEHILEWFPEEDMLIADGFDEAIIGIEESSMRIIYSESKCIRVLMRDQGLSEEDAVEHYQFNVKGAYVGEKTPIWCIDTL
jgi:hypothetical protein